MLYDWSRHYELPEEGSDDTKFICRGCGEEHDVSQYFGKPFFEVTQIVRDWCEKHRDECENFVDTKSPGSGE